MKKTIKRILAVTMCVLMTLTAAPLSGLAGLDLPDLFSLKAEATNGISECPYGKEYYDLDGKYHDPCSESGTDHCHCEVVNGEAVVIDFYVMTDGICTLPPQ